MELCRFAKPLLTADRTSSISSHDGARSTGLPRNRRSTRRRPQLRFRPEISSRWACPQPSEHEGTRTIGGQEQSGPRPAGPSPFRTRTSPDFGIGRRTGAERQRRRRVQRHDGLCDARRNCERQVVHSRRGQSMRGTAVIAQTCPTRRRVMDLPSASSAIASRPKQKALISLMREMLASVGRTGANRR